MSKAVDLLFLGTGTSAGVPMIGCDCEVCTSDDPRDKRTRCSVVISYAGTTVLVDTTPELRLQSIWHDVKHVDAVVFTHAHADHILGLDDLRRFNAIKQGPLDIWADAATHGVLQHSFAYAWQVPDPASRLFRPHLIPRTIDGPFDIEGQTWTPVRFDHGKASVLGYRVGNLAYCTDVSEVSSEAMTQLQDLDILIIDGLQWRKHPTHLTVDEALDVIDQLQPKRAYLTHMSHGVFHARDEAKLPDHVRFAYDGLRISTDTPG